MELRLVRRHLAEAERHVALSDKHITRQLEIIEELERGGHPTSLALCQKLEKRGQAASA